MKAFRSGLANIFTGAICVVVGTAVLTTGKFYHSSLHQPVDIALPWIPGGVLIAGGLYLVKSGVVAVFKPRDPD